MFKWRIGNVTKMKTIIAMDRKTKYGERFILLFLRFYTITLEIIYSEVRSKDDKILIIYIVDVRLIVI